MIQRVPYERPSTEEIFNSCVASGFFPAYLLLHAMGSDIINANASLDATIEYLKKEVPDLVKKIRKVEERATVIESERRDRLVCVFLRNICV